MGLYRHQPLILSPATVHHYGRVVKILFNWAEEEEYLDNNPIRRLKLRSPGYKDVEPHSDEEVQAMLNLCEDEARFRHRYLGLRNKAIISLFVATGLAEFDSLVKSILVKVIWQV